MYTHGLVAAGIMGAALMLSGCGDDDARLPLPTSTPSRTATLPATRTSTATTIATASATVPPSATATVPPSATATTPPTATATAPPTTTASASPTPSVTATATATQVPIAEQLAATGVGKYLGGTATSMQTNGAWEEYLYDPATEGAICLRGAPYQVNLRRASSNKVLLYLEGGGACWNYQNCWVTPVVKITAGPANGLGILETSNPQNPFADWNVIYAPYCDGSVFSGDNIADYNGRRTYHHGVQNLSAAVSLMQREFPNPDVIVVAGSSAGGYGTFSGYGVTRVGYPNAPILVLDDSGPGIQNPSDTVAAQARIDNWKLTQYIPTTCTRCDIQVAYLTAWALERDPTLRTTLFNYLEDTVLRFFLQLDANGFEMLLRDTSGVIHDEYPQRFKRFLPRGESHTVLLLPEFHELTIGATTVRDWTADFLTDGSAWRDLLDP